MEITNRYVFFKEINGYVRFGFGDSFSTYAETVSFLFKKKKINTIIINVIIILFIVNQIFPTKLVKASSLGTTADNPIVIMSASDLNEMRMD